jgi:hypothetical protein
MWIPTQAEGIEMFARFWTARRGKRASNSARKIAKSFELKGDLEGQKAWDNVADAIERREQESRRAVRQESVMAPSSSNY